MGREPAPPPRPPIEPCFAPGSGWYQTGQMSPGSLRDREAMRESALPEIVVVLRRRGARVPAAELLRTEPPAGLLLAMDRYTAPAWHCCLFVPDMEHELLPRLLHARLERENDGVRLYGGIEPGDRGQPDFRQAWLCAPTPARAREILLNMLERAGGAP
jgi:hypothetical protein